MRKNYRQKGGFTLPELMVAMSVIVMVIVAATNIVVSIIRSNAENINTMIAYGLAQEGVEAVRNIRDSDWLLGAKYNGSLKNVAVWDEEFEDLTTEENYYLLDIRTLETAPGQVTTPYALRDYTPWKLTQLQPQDFDGEKTLIKKYTIDEQKGTFRYAHQLGFNQTGEDTPFHRYIIVKKETTDYDDPGNPREVKKYRVASVVEWMEYGRPRAVRLDTELTDWYQGQ